MASIGSTYFYLGVPSLPPDEFEKYATRVFEEWEVYVGNNLSLQDYSLSLEFEEGSIKAASTIGATLAAIYIGIGQYGSFISGLETIQRQVKDAGDFLSERASAPFQGTRIKPRVQKRGDSLASLEKLFVKVQSSEITVDDAMAEAERIFGDELAEAPGFVGTLKNSLEDAPLYGKQISLPLEDFDTGQLLPKEQHASLPKPKKPQPPKHKLRVEVWRETKESERKVRVVKL
ncbi:MAG: hypothetical protein OEW58_13600 [Gammaproteobacteria bacterium]|nr:hypothetical protein [Gammaproteobacteria bacterium]